MSSRNREPSVATLRRLAEAVQKRWPESVSYIGQMFGTDFAEAVAAYRSEIAPIRTRAEVDAEIAEECRNYYQRVTKSDGSTYRADGKAPQWDAMTKGEQDRLNALCREPTRDSVQDDSSCCGNSKRANPCKNCPLLSGPSIADACSVCGGKGYTDNCQCAYVHSCKVCPAGPEWEKRVGKMENPNR